MPAEDRVDTKAKELLDAFNRSMEEHHVWSQFKKRYWSTLTEEEREAWRTFVGRVGMIFGIFTPTPQKKLTNLTKRKKP